jgi:tRNA threonylcarbamoyladenosine biosynthesis protein TsaB
VHVLAETTVDCHRRHSERLLASVDWALNEASLSMDDMDALAISIGPGSFTGLRIGAATWKGLAFAKKLPLIAVPTLDALARQSLAWNGLVCPCLDARMKEVFAAIFQAREGRFTEAAPPQACSMETLLSHPVWRDGCGAAPPLFLGDGAQLYRDEIIEAMPQARFADAPALLPRASAVAAEAFRLWRAGAQTEGALAAPLYLRQSQAEVNRAKNDSAAQGA